MPRVDFYLLNRHVPNGKLRAVCRLSQKIYSLGQAAFIHTEDIEQAKELDDLLWTFDQGSFVPHSVQQDAEEMPNTPLLLGGAPPPQGRHDVLISLGKAVPDCYAQYERICEFVDDTAEEKASARERYRFYRDQGLAPGHHDISP